MSVLDVLAARPRCADSGRIGLISSEGSLAWHDLESLVDRRAGELLAGGLEPGAVHPLTVDADRDGVVELLALWRVQAVPVPLNPRLTDDERSLALGMLRAAPPDCQAILWTSGTAGRPRGVALGRAGLLAHVEAVAERLALDGSEVWLASLSPAHVGGLALVARAVLTGATAVTPGPLDPEALARLLRGASPAVTHLSLVPTQLDRLLAVWGPGAAPPQLRCILIGGAHAPTDLVTRATAAGWPLALTYGMTEMWSQVATATPTSTRLHPGAVGSPLAGVEVRIAADQEIHVRGPTLALGYVVERAPSRGPEAEGAAPPGDPPPGGEPVRTAPATHASPVTDADGWYRTGDLGDLDDEGLLRITGRLSDRIISGGVNVDPVEVEEVLRRHPAVLDAAVVGVPSREWGETVGAVVVPVWGEFELSEVEAFLRAKLGGAKRPRVWKMERRLPLNANGKLDRAAARALFTTG